jgi:hypothetical protein
MRLTAAKPAVPRLTVRLVCWNADLARERAAALERAGFEVDATPLNPAGLIGYFRQHMPR